MIENDNIENDSVEIISSFIVTVSNAKKAYFKDLISEIIAESGTISPIEINENACISIHEKYYHAVAACVFDYLIEKDENIAMLIAAALRRPVFCGYEEIDFSSPCGLIGGNVLAVSHWALTGKIAPEDACILVNHKQGDVLHEALVELDRELFPKEKKYKESASQQTNQRGENSHPKFYCFNCGAQNNINANFCKKCGTKLK